MDLINISSYTLRNLSTINIVLGKNGCGKSTMLRQVEAQLSNDSAYGKTKYLTPERGGALIYEAGVEQSLSNNINWLSGQRRRNQANNFRQQSVAQYRKLETLVLREIESSRRGEIDYTFAVYINKINSLLDNIEIKRNDTTFKICKKGTDEAIGAESISSGESELISLGIESLIFSKECVVEKENILFLDEPDVHLHPDLQVRLMHFLKDLVTEGNFRVLIATHSTAILGALESYAHTHLGFMISSQKDIQFSAISGVYRKILPVFGAHPLSNIFNQAPVLLVEGEDDERIWQQAVRSGADAIKLYPCSVDGVGGINGFEQEAQKIIKTVYDNAKGFSLRDRDDNPEEITDLLPIVRMRLSCRNAENLLLSDEVLTNLGTTWEQVKTGIETWLIANSAHAHFPIMQNFKSGGYNRKGFDIKEIRNDLMGIIASSKPWEIAVGQVISTLRWSDSTTFNEDGKIFSFLGEKTTRNLIPKSV
jgi:predicted ATPase